MIRRVRKSEIVVLDAIAAHGGSGVGSLQVNRHLGSGPYTPIFFALEALTRHGYLDEAGYGVHQDGSPGRGWSLTARGRAALATPPRSRLLGSIRQVFAKLMRPSARTRCRE